MNRTFLDDGSGLLCKILEWDTSFFGFKIAQVAKRKVTLHEADLMISWATRDSIRCIYLLTEVDDGDTIRVAEDSGFHLMGVRMTLENNRILLDQKLPASMDGNITIRASEAEDIPILREIAKVSHHHTHFYQDQNFQREMCDSLYETWVENNCKGSADTVLVILIDHNPIGYVSCHLSGNERGRIGLTAIAPGFRGRTLGVRLLTESLSWFMSRGVRQVSVVAHGRNYVAQRLYQKLGFRTTAMELWYHKWL